jgi:PKD repeat protein
MSILQSSNIFNQKAMKKNTLIMLVFVLIISKPAFPQDTLILRPFTEGKDALITTIYPDDTNGQTQNQKCMAWTHSGVPGLNRSLIEFDLTMIPQSSLILDARLNFYFATFEPTYVTHTGENASYLMMITQPWEEHEVVWNNQPATTLENVVILPQSSDPEQDYTDLDVTVPVQYMVSHPEMNHGWMLRLITEVHYRSLMFASGDCLEPEKRPMLEIIYMECVEPAAAFETATEGLSAYFTSTSAYATNWYWSFGDGYYSDLAHPWHYYQEPGTYEVCLTVWNGCGSDTICQWVDVCVLPVSDFDFFLEDLTAFFEDKSFQADQYYWDFGDGYYSDLPNPIHIYDNGDNYQVCLTTWNECGENTACQMLYLSSVGMNENHDSPIMLFPNPARETVNIKALESGPCVLFIIDPEGKTLLRLERSFIENETFAVSLGQIPPGMYFIKAATSKNVYFSKLIIMK